MKLFRTLGAAVALMALAACAHNDGGQVDPGQTIRNASNMALTTYGDVFQPALIIYGRLPDCPKATICKERAPLDKMKALDAKAVAAISAARPVLNGSTIDKGELGKALAAIAEAQAAIANSGALRLSQ